MSQKPTGESCGTRWAVTMPAEASGPGTTEGAPCGHPLGSQRRATVPSGPTLRSACAPSCLRRRDCTTRGTGGYPP